MLTIYLDVCCLNRPFDDQSQDKIRLESESVLLVLQHFESEDWQWVKSSVIDHEIDQTPNPERRSRVKLLAAKADKVIKLSEAIIKRGTEIQSMGFQTYDALHIACAEKGNADILLTTDDRFLKLGKRFAKKFNTSIRNPLSWIQEVI